ncbi:MAG: transposase [Flavobacteriales bacterium]|nr:transposase [Flavobacteriales bacterium]
MVTPTITVSNITRHGRAKIVETEINYNKALNETLIKSTKRLGLLHSSKKYTLDMDATFVSTKCQDAKANSRKKTLGYSPMVCLIERMPVHISFRCGNAGAAMNIREDFESCIELLNKSKVKIGRVRSDAAGYNKLFLEKINEMGIMFNVRMPFFKNNKGLTTRLDAYDNWKDVTIETSDQIWECEIGDINYDMYDSDMKGRIICLKVPDEETLAKTIKGESERRLLIEKKLEKLEKKGLLKRKGKLHDDAWSNYKGFNYKLIFTNDFETSPKDLIIEYNKRGGAERNFEYLKNDFGWRYPPFMYLAENNVYLIITALINNIYISALRNFNKYVKGINNNTRLPMFIDIVIEIPCLIMGKDSFEFYVDKTTIDIAKIC